MCLCVCLFVYSCLVREAPPRKPIIAAVVVRWCFRLKAVRKGLLNSTCDRDDSIICQLPTGAQRAASLLPPSGSFLFLARVSKSDQSPQRRDKVCPLVFYAESNILLRLYLHRSVAWVFSFHFGFLLPSAFMFSYKRVQSVNSNYPPFLSLNQSFGDHTCFPKPSKQLWLWCWPRFTVVLKQYAVLCLGFFFFLGMVYECTHSSVIVYSPKSACYNVLWQPVWVCWTLRRVIKCDVRLVWLMIIALLSQFCLDPISIGWYLHEFLESEFRDRWYSRLLEDISAQHNEFGWIHRTGSFCEHVK